jgi:hypothetical protein
MEKHALMKKVSRKPETQNFGVNGANVQGIHIYYEESSL